MTLMKRMRPNPHGAGCKEVGRNEEKAEEAA
jgi:hypothetical protein